jgi:hypothetical protein
MFIQTLTMNDNDARSPKLFKITLQKYLRQIRRERGRARSELS